MGNNNCFMNIRKKDNNQNDENMYKDDNERDGYYFKGFKEIETDGYRTVDPDYITMICISDSHSNYKGLTNLPKADLLIHSGDF